MRKYVIFIDNVGNMSMSHFKTRSETLLTDLKKKGIVGKHDICCVVQSEGASRIETLPMSIFEKISVYLDRFLGTFKSIVKGE